MEKITLKNIDEISRRFNRNTFYANSFYLLEKCFYEELEGELIIGQPSIKREGEFNLINVPENVSLLDKYKNFTLIYKEDIKKLEDKGFIINHKEEIGPEFFYDTKDFIKMEGGAFATFRKKVHHFENEYQPNVIREYDIEKTTDFINKWVKNKKVVMNSSETEGMEREAKENIEVLELLERVPNKSFFVEINGQLIGFQITVPINNKLWGAIYQKADHSYKGLTEFLYLVSAKENQAVNYFTSGSGGKSEGIINYKRELNPSEEKMLYFVSGELR